MKNLSPIIPVNSSECQVQSWKKHLKEAVSDPLELLSLLGLDKSPLKDRVARLSSFRTRVPMPFIDKMSYGDPNDPLLLQVLPLLKEDQLVDGFGFDPLAENTNQPPGILHKYQGRLLVLLASTCAVNCRYCFRRHFPYSEKSATGESFHKAIEYIRGEESISEVILSGGDPLIVSDSSLESLANQLSEMKHVKRLRIHTRLPVVIPQRITDKLCEIMQNSRLKSSVVLHVNHANEVDEKLSKRLHKLKSSGVMIFNQSVLLKGVNNSVEAICELSEKLFETGVIPYYIHLLDKVQGAAHFEVCEEEAKLLLEEARKRLPGYLMPRLAREIPGESSKTLIG